MPLCHEAGVAQLLLSSQGHTNKGMALGEKLGAQTLTLPSAVWAAEPHTINSHGDSVCAKLFTKSVWALAWAIFSSRNASIWLLITCLASLCRSIHTGPLLSSPRSEFTWHKSSTVKRYTLDADKAMQHNNNPQEPMTETKLPNRPLAMITTGNAWVKPRSATIKYMSP
jgi:hypothetical protein